MEYIGIENIKWTACRLRLCVCVYVCVCLCMCVRTGSGCEMCSFLQMVGKMVMNTYLPRVLNGIQRVNLFLPAFPFSTPSLESGPLSHKSKPHPTAPRERNRRQVLINFIFFLLLGQWFSTPACTLESPGELLEIPMLRPHPRPIKPGSLGKHWSTRIFFFKVPSDSSVQQRVRDPMFGRKRTWPQIHSRWDGNSDKI